jgi:Secretion system C-terminal sorting domain
VADVVKDRRYVDDDYNEPAARPETGRPLRRLDAGRELPVRRQGRGVALGAHQGATPSVDVALSRGFNLVGLPLDVTTTSVTSLFPTASAGTFLAYDGSVLSAPNPAVLKPGEGYWLHFATAGTQRVTGLPAASRTWALRAGWNLVSGPTCAISLDAVDDPSAAIDHRLLFGFEGEYVMPEGNLLVPGKGYWVFATKAATATLTCGSASKSAPALALLGRGNDVLASKNQAEELGRRLASLPPVPTAFDAHQEGLAVTDGPLPTEFALDQNYPNPFSGRTEIRFALPEAAHVSLRIVDMLGREVVRVVDTERQAGWHVAEVSGESLSSGLYLYELTAGHHRAVRTLLIVR